MQHFLKILAVTTITFSSGAAYADLGDQLFYLVASDGGRGNNFGYSVALNRNIVAVGAYYNNNENGSGAGAVYLYNVNTGKPITKIIPHDGSHHDWFGHSVAISSQTIIVGAPYDDDNGMASGSAYLFNSSTYSQIAKLLPNDGSELDLFGVSVDISGNIAIVGAYTPELGIRTGSAYLFDASTGQQIAKLLPDDGAKEDRFGLSVAISGNTAIVGAYWDDENGFYSGAAYLFDATTGQQIAKLLAEDGYGSDTFGYSVAISGPVGKEIAVIGAYGDRDNGSQSGSAYLFDVATRQQLAKLKPDDGSEFDTFGYDVAISGPVGEEIAVIGALGDDDNGSWSGSAYLFDVASGKQLVKLLPHDGEEDDQFGCAVAIQGSNVVVGAKYHYGVVRNSGAAYIFDATHPARTTATLTNFNVINGDVLNGTLADLESSDDAYLHTRSGFGETLVDLHNMEMSILAEAPGSDPTTIDLTIESRIDEPAGLAQIRMKNFNTRDFDIVGSYSIGNTDAVEQITGLDASKYYNTNNGRMRVKIKHLVFVPFLAFTFESFIDQVEITVN